MDGDVIDAAHGPASIASSGSRLKLSWVNTADGVSVPFDSPWVFFDAARGERCVRQSWSDGALRCTPSVSDNTGLVYSDSACATAVIQTGSTGPTQPYVIQYADNPQAGIQTVFAPGPELSSLPNTIWNRVNGACVNPVVVGSHSSDRFYSTVAVANTAFVELTPVTTPGSDPLEPIEYHSADGVLWPVDSAYSTAAAAACDLIHSWASPTTATCGSSTLSRGYDATSTTRLRPIYLTYPPSFDHYDHFLYDTTLGTECAFAGNVGDSTSACYPYPVTQITSLYADGGCATPVDVIEIIPPDVVPVYAYRPRVGLPAELHRVGAQHLSNLYWGGPGACELFTGAEAPPNAKFYDVDAAVTGADQLGVGSIVLDP